MHKRNFIRHLLYYFFLILMTFSIIHAVNAQAQVIIDNGDPGTSSVGKWYPSGGVNPYGENSLFCKYSGNYTYEASLSGPYEVSLYWTQTASRCTSVEVEIFDGDSLLDTQLINQREDGGQWNVFGIYDFSGTAKVNIISQGGCSTSADAVSFVSATLP